MAVRVKEIVTCDRCKATDLSAPVTVYPVIGWITCPAGGSGDNDTVRVDLCTSCAAKLLMHALAPKRDSERKEWITLVTSGKKLT